MLSASIGHLYLHDRINIKRAPIVFIQVVILTFNFFFLF